MYRENAKPAAERKRWKMTFLKSGMALGLVSFTLSYLAAAAADTNYVGPTVVWAVITGLVAGICVLVHYARQS